MAPVYMLFFIPQNFSSLGFAVSEELGNKQTDSLTDWCFDREIRIAGEWNKYFEIKGKFEEEFKFSNLIVNGRAVVHFAPFPHPLPGI